MLELNYIYQMDCLKGIDEIEYCDLLITDVPYNISQKPHSKGYRELDYGDWDKQDNEEIYKRIYKAAEKTRNACYIFCADQQFSTIYNYFKSKKDWVARTLVSLKTNPTVINCDKLYAPSQDLIVFAKRRGGLYKPKYKKSYFTYSVPTGKNRYHPSQKPLGLIKEFIEDTSNIGDIICDIFAGSGTTLVAAKELQRQYIGFEIMENYTNIINERLNNLK
jgi:site-specific DNA-methyltransferase (adenine-specific)